MKEESTETIPCHVSGTVYQDHNTGLNYMSNGSEWNLLNTSTADATCLTVDSTGTIGTATIPSINTGTVTYGLGEWSNQTYVVDGGSVDLTPTYDPNHISIDIKSKKVTLIDFTGNFVEYDIISMHSVFDKKFDCSKRDQHVITAEREITVPEIKLLIKKEILTDFFDDIEEDRYGLKNTELTLHFQNQFISPGVYTREQDWNNYHITISDYVPNGTSIGITGTGGNAGSFTTTVQPLGITTCTAVIDQAAISKTVSDYQAIFNST